MTNVDSSAQKTFVPKLRYSSARACDTRERQRQRNVNQAFVDLRSLLPTYPPDKKLSKHEVLRLSIKYIHVLESILNHQEESDRAALTSFDPTSRHLSSPCLPYQGSRL